MRLPAAPRPPLPLVHSQKCPRCSLVGLCLPDETNALIERDELQPRTIVPRDPDNQPVYITEQGAYVGVRSARMLVTKSSDLLGGFRLIDVSQLCLYGNVQVSAQALSELWRRGVPVLWYSYGGWLRGWAQGEMSRYVELRRRQVVVHAQGASILRGQLSLAKVRNSGRCCDAALRSTSASRLNSCVGFRVPRSQQKNAQSLLGVEGVAARIYFGAFTAMLRDQQFAAQFDANGGSRRPAPDPVNALLGFVYSLLVKDLVAVCLGVGLDPYLGVYHRPRYGRPALALDLMEEFRPLVADSVVINLLNNGEVGESDFEQRGRAVWLTERPQARDRIVRTAPERSDHSSSLQVQADLPSCDGCAGQDDGFP